MPSIRISEDTYKRLQDYAKNERRSIQNAADHLLIKYLIEYPDISSTSERAPEAQNDGNSAENHA